MQSVWVIVLGFLLSSVCTIGILVHIAQDLKRRGRSEHPTVSDVAIVLGAYTNGFAPSPPLVARLRTALYLYRYGFVKTIIVSGGQGPDETVSESKSMKRFLVMNGIPPTAILEDRYSTDTWENLYNSTALMKQFAFQSAVIVTSDYHLPRALAVARQLKLNASGLAAYSRRNEFRYAVREVLARVQYTVKGQASIT